MFVYMYFGCVKTRTGNEGGEENSFHLHENRNGWDELDLCDTFESDCIPFRITLERIRY